MVRFILKEKSNIRLPCLLFFFKEAFCQELFNLTHVPWSIIKPHGITHIIQMIKTYTISLASARMSPKYSFLYKPLMMQEFHDLRWGQDILNNN